MFRLLMLLMLLCCGKLKSQEMPLHLYIGYQGSWMFKLPQHFSYINSGYQQLYGGEFEMSHVGRGIVCGIRLGFGEAPLAIEYCGSRKVSYSNKAEFPDKTGQYRMRYGTHSFGFIFGNQKSPVRLGFNFDFGNVTWEKKEWFKTGNPSAKWIDLVETTEIMWMKGPLYLGVNTYAIISLKQLELRPYMVWSPGITEYHDYSTPADHPMKMNHAGVMAYFALQVSK